MTSLFAVFIQVSFSSKKRKKSWRHGCLAIRTDKMNKTRYNLQLYDVIPVLFSLFWYLL